MLGRTPNTIKEIKVTIPHFNAIASSTTTNPNYYSIIIFTKA
jgi:hypothetical protein